MCKFFNVSRSGYYEFIKRIDRPEKDAYLVSLIKYWQERVNMTYGHRRIKIWLLRESDHVVNHKAILRIMHKYGLLSQVRRRKRYTQYGRQLHKYENILNRDFKVTKCNEKWVTDISYIHTSQGVLYLSVIKDLFDGSIVSYKTGTEQSVTLVTDTIKKAMKKEKIAYGLQLHSDQGFQYTSLAYFNLTKDYGITPSMSRRGNCLDNACVTSLVFLKRNVSIERDHGHLKMLVT